MTRRAPRSRSCQLGLVSRKRQARTFPNCSTGLPQLRWPGPCRGAAGQRSDAASVAATRLVRSAASARAEAAPAAESGGGRRRRGGRGRAAAAAASALDEGVDSSTKADDVTGSSAESNGGSLSAAVEAPVRRPEPELLAVPMSDAQEQVFGWLGLNPALLLDTPPDSDNLMVRVVRPGEREEEVLEQARRHGGEPGRRRRGGRGGGRSGGGRSSISEGATKANASASEPSHPVGGNHPFGGHVQF